MNLWKKSVGKGDEAKKKVEACKTGKNKVSSVM